MGILLNIKKRGYKDIFSTTKILAVIEKYIFRKYFNIAFVNADSLGDRIELSDEDTLAYYEQVVFRLSQYPCNSCKNGRGECKHCGCQLPDKWLTLKGSCMGEDQQTKVWGDIMSAQDWDNYKEELGITFNITYN